MKATFRSAIATVVVLLNYIAPATQATPLHPEDFSSLGPSPFTTNGTYTIDTSGTTPILMKPDSSTIAGIVTNGIAVFTFDNITIDTNVTVNGLQNVNSRPLALLSHGDITISGVMNVSGANGANNSGYSGGNGGNAGPGGGGGGGGGGNPAAAGAGGSGGLGFVNGGAGYGGGGNGGSVVAGGGGGGAAIGCGGAFGGNGGSGYFSCGGTAYGDLVVTLQGGSGGGGGGAPTSVSPGGGGGGGAVEINALSNINITVGGAVLANGGTTGSGGGIGGGGAGGGIVVQGVAVTLSGDLSAAGGGGAGGGGGGRVLILTADGTLAGGSLASNINVSGGGNGSPGFKAVCVARVPNRPPVAKCHDVSVSGGGNCKADASIDDGSFDPDACDMITLVQSPPGPYQLGLTSVTLTVTDNHGASSNCTATVTVADDSACTNLTVSTVADSGAGSLRQALANAANGDTIDASFVTGTILLTSGELLVTNSVAIVGPGPNLLAVNGNHASRVFHIRSNTVVTISSLTITNGRTSPGAGIYNDHGTLTVSNCTFTRNEACCVNPQGGGGIYNDHGTLTVTDSSLNDNTAYWGGGIYNNAGTMNVSASTLSGNNAPYVYSSGGGIYNAGMMTVSASTLSGNSATISKIGGGGGICNIGTITVSASTLSGNSASYGGGILNTNGTMTVTACTLSANSASKGGGGILNTGFSALMQIGNSILNAGASGANIQKSGGVVTSDGYNLSSDDGGGVLTNATDQINTDPMFGSLQSNGGPTFTHALLPGSPAIDQGKNLTGSATDQRGLPRPLNDPCVGNFTGGDDSDVGAFEVQQVCQPLDIQIIAIQPVGNNLRLRYGTALGGNYVVQTSSNMTSGGWTSLPGTNVGIGVVMQSIVTNALAAPQGVYRIQQLP